MSETRPKPERGWERHECPGCGASEGECYAAPVTNLRAVKCCPDCDHHYDCRGEAKAARVAGALALLEAAEVIEGTAPGLANWLRQKHREVREEAGR